MYIINFTNAVSTFTIWFENYWSYWIVHRDAETNTPPITSSQLSHLSDIKEITGYLLIENVNFTNLRFLRNLEVLHGVQTIEYRSGQHYALIIEGNDNLQTLSLSSLQRIENGGIRISGNPQLCLVDTLAVDEFLVSSTLRRIGGLGMDCSGECNCIKV